MEAHTPPRKADRPPGCKAPSCVSLVERTLNARNDFMTARGLLEALPQLTINQVIAALHHLRKVAAANAIEQDNGLWWYLTPETDKRCRTVDERVVEEPGHRKPRKSATNGLGPQGQMAAAAIAERAAQISLEALA